MCRSCSTPATRAAAPAPPPKKLSPLADDDDRHPGAPTDAVEPPPATWLSYDMLPHADADAALPLPPTPTPGANALPPPPAAPANCCRMPSDTARWPTALPVTPESTRARHEPPPDDGPPGLRLLPLPHVSSESPVDGADSGPPPPLFCVLPCVLPSAGVSGFTVPPPLPTPAGPCAGRPSSAQPTQSSTWPRSTSSERNLRGAAHRMASVSAVGCAAEAWRGTALGDAPASRGREAPAAGHRTGSTTARCAPPANHPDPSTEYPVPPSRLTTSATPRRLPPPPPPPWR